MLSLPSSVHFSSVSLSGMYLSGVHFSTSSVYAFLVCISLVFAFLRISAFNHKLLYPTPKFNKLFIIFQGSLFLCQKDTEKALFTKFAKVLKVLDVVILHYFI